MNEIKQLLSSPAFWFGAIFIAFIVNIASSYIKPVIDKAFSSVSGRYKKYQQNKEEKKQKELETYLRVIESSPNPEAKLLTWISKYHHNESRLYYVNILSIFIMLCGLILVFLAPQTDYNVPPELTFVEKINYINEHSDEYDVDTRSGSAILYGLFLILGACASSFYSNKIDNERNNWKERIYHYEESINGPEEIPKEE